MYSRQPVGICCMMRQLKSKSGARWQPRGVGLCGRWEGGWRGRGYLYTYGWFMLKYSRNQHIVKQISSLKMNKLKKKSLQPPVTKPTFKVRYGPMHSISSTPCPILPPAPKMSNSLRSHGLQHARLPCPLSPWVCSNSKSVLRERNFNPKYHLWAGNCSEAHSTMISFLQSVNQ